MSAETLREAARLMRERAEAATPGPWDHYGDHLVWPSEQGPAAGDPIAGVMLGPAHEESGAHIASWHPAVALAVADWLEQEAWDVQRRHKNVMRWMPDAGIELDDIHVDQRALAVAKAYLGDP